MQPFEMLRKCYSGSNVLVTGGLGFIGSNLAIALADSNAKVTVVDSNMPETGANLYNLNPIADQVKIVNADIGDRSIMDRLVKDQDFIFNLAGLLSHTESMLKPLEDLHANCFAHVQFLEACRKNAPHAKILYTASRSQYGRTTGIVSETHPLQPLDVNGINKTAAESYHLLYGKHYDMHTCSVRVVNTYGPRHQMLHPRQGVFNWLVKQVIDEKPIVLFGDGKQVRDLNYVDDTVRALLMALAQDQARGQILNIGGSPASLLDTAELLIRIVGKGSIEIRPFPERSKNVEIGNFVADVKKIKNLLGWSPQIMPEEGFTKTINYFREHQRHYWLHSKA